MAGEVVAQALESGDTSRSALASFERQWRKRFGADLDLGHRINQRIARWDDAKWELTPEQFAEPLKTNLTGGWLWRFLASNSLNRFLLVAAQNGAL